MKVKELIKHLSECDPEAETLIDGTDIYYVESLPGYYDGHYATIIHNESKRPHYSPVGMHFTREGVKVQLRSLSLEDLIWSCESPEQIEKLVLNLDSSLSSFQKQEILKKIEITKKEVLAFFKENK